MNLTRDLLNKLLKLLIFSGILIGFVQEAKVTMACTTHWCCGGVGDNGCVYSTFSGAFTCNCDGVTLYCDPGPCLTCTPPSCPSGYTTTNTSCSTTTTSCTKYNCHSSCGTVTRTCYLLRYTLTYTAGSNGSISGTTSQSICQGSSGTAVTAVPNSGYHFVNWSDSSTANPRTDTNVTANISVTANFAISNQPPTAATGLLTESQTNPTNITNITPEFSAIYNDPDTSDQSSYYEIEVNTASDFTGTVMWDSGKTAMTTTNQGTRSPNITYNGTTLTYDGNTYYWRIRFWDSHDVVATSWSSIATFTMAIPTSSYYEIEVNTSSDFTGTVMWDSGKTAMTTTTSGQRSPTLTYAGSTLIQGTTYYWRIRFWDMNDNVSIWSDTATFQLDQTPTQPTSLQTESLTNPTKVTDTTPEFSAIYNDPDNTDQANYYQIEVNTSSDFTGTVMWDSGKTTMTTTNQGSRSPEISYNGTTLSTGEKYYWRIKFWDIAGLEGSWSAISNFQMSGPPIASSLLILDQTNPMQVVYDIYFSAISTDPNGDNSSAYQIQVNTTNTFDGTMMWDSTKTSTTITSGNRSSDIYYNGTPLLYDGTTYYVRMKFWDTDDNEGDWITAQFTDTLKSFLLNGLQMNGIQLN